MKMEGREPIYCDCHGPVHGVVMGYRSGDRVVWYDKRHGQNHVKVLEGLTPQPESGIGINSGQEKR